jgi:hypothetical protein
MPELSRFYGIVIYMFAKNHLPPHFHAKYGEHIGVIDIRTGESTKAVYQGELYDWYRIGRNFIKMNY